jgi:hypothetical protein
MQHTVITAFNIFGRNEDEFLVPRMRMFKELALPSIKKQSDKGFTWIVLIDSDSPPAFVSELKELVPADTIIQEVEKASINQRFKGKKGAISTLAQPVNHVPRIIGPHLVDDWVSTVSLAVDDAIAVDFIEKVKETAMPYKELLVFPSGALKMDAGNPKKDGYYKVKSEIFFVVAVEPSETFESVYAGGAHHYSDEKRKIETAEPMWLWHLHGLDQNCNPNSNFRMVPLRQPYTHEEVKGRFSYEGSASRFE